MDCDAVSSLVNLVRIFKKYASKDEDTEHLSKSDLKELLVNEFSMSEECTKPDDINQILADLDQDGDGKVDIIEYFVVLVGVGVALFEASNAIEWTWKPATSSDVD